VRFGYAQDAARGKLIFADENRAACIKCHSVDGQADKAGPDLSAIADKFSHADLIRSVVEPSATIAVGYGTTIIGTKADDEYQGIIKQATESWVELMGGDGKAVLIPISDIRVQRNSEISLMPEGLVNGLSPQEFGDLIAYLETMHMPVQKLAVQRGMPENIPQASRNAELRPFFSGAAHLTHPLWFGEMPGHSDRFVVLEHAGKSWIVERASDGDHQTALLDLSGEVRVGGATGLLGFAFHPKFLKNRKYYLKYHALKEGRIVTRLAEREFASDFKHDSGKASRLLLEMESVTQDHNGGTIEFGPDGYLYLGMGDSGPQRDPQGRGQDLSVLLGKILRLDVDRVEAGRQYGIPPSNPFLNHPEIRPEIWAYGFREPWRFSFDSATGDLWVGDVGQDRVEEVTLVRAGENHGWNVFEGHTPYSERYRREGENYIAPVFSYSHRIGVSVTGGYVYHGQRAPLLRGHYVCGDFETRRFWALTQTNRLLSTIVEIGRAPTRVSSFAQDSSGELYVVGYDAGVIYRLDLATVDPIPRESQVILATSEENPALWRYTLETPINGWFGAAFDDTAWRLSPAGFGTKDTPGTVVRTDWHTSDIWLRRFFDFVDKPETKGRSLALRLHHDEDAEIYLNGIEVARIARWTTGYIELPLGADGRRALRNGRNVLAIHCRQNSGGQYIDAGLIGYFETKAE
jgi:putative heme-binding domain-containing protein